MLQHRSVTQFLALALAGLLSAAAAAQPEAPAAPDRPQRDEAARFRREVQRQEEARAQAQQRMRALQERRPRSDQEDEPPLIRVFDLTPLGNIDEEARGKVLAMVLGLGKALPIQVAPVGNRLLVAGPRSAVAAVGQTLAVLDPATHPYFVTLTARVYLAAVALPPDFAAPAEDPLLGLVGERSGYPTSALLHVSTVSGLEGDPLRAESEARIEGDEMVLSSRFALTVTPSVVGAHLHLRAAGEMMAELGPGLLRRSQFETTLRTLDGQPAVFVATDPLLKTAFVLVLTAALER